MKLDEVVSVIKKYIKESDDSEKEFWKQIEEEFNLTIEFDVDIEKKLKTLEENLRNWR